MNPVGRLRAALTERRVRRADPDDVIRRLYRIIENPATKDSDRIAAAKLLADLGYLKTVEEQQNREANDPEIMERVFKLLSAIELQDERECQRLDETSPHRNYRMRDWRITDAIVRATLIALHFMREWHETSFWMTWGKLRKRPTQEDEDAVFERGHAQRFRLILAWQRFCEETGFPGRTVLSIHGGPILLLELDHFQNSKALEYFKGYAAVVEPGEPTQERDKIEELVTLFHSQWPFPSVRQIETTVP